MQEIQFKEQAYNMLITIGIKKREDFIPNDC